MGKLRDASQLLEWIHLITTLQILAEFTGTFTFGTYSLQKPRIDAGLPDDIGAICDETSNKNSSQCLTYKAILDRSAKILGDKSLVGLVISMVTFMFGAVSDVVGRKTMLQFYLFFSFLASCLTTFFITFEYDPVYLVYAYIVYCVGGGYSLLFVISFAHVVEVTPIEQRQVGICLMEMAIYVAELFILPYGFVLDAYGLTGTKVIQWFATTLIFTGTMIFTFYYRSDTPNERTVLKTVGSIFGGMKNVWLTYDPAVFVVPAGIAFFFFIMMFIGNVSIFQDYLRAPPYSASQAEYSGVTGFRGLVALLYTGVLIVIQSWHVNEYIIVIIGIAAMSLQNILFGFGTSVWYAYIGTFIGGAAHFVIPVLRKLMAERVPETLYGSLFAIPSWIECGGTSVSSIIYTRLYRIDPFDAGWIYWGYSNALTLMSALFTGVCYLVRNKI